MYDPIVDSATDAVTTWVKNNAAKSGNYKIDGMSVTFRATASYGVFGIGSTAVAIGCAFIPNLIAKLFFGGCFGIFGVLILLYGYVMQLTLDPERIIYRGPFGLKKQILWSDIQSVFVVSAQFGDIMVQGRNSRIRIFAYLAGFPKIKELLLTRFPSSFDAEAALKAGNSNQFKKVHGSNVFKLKKDSGIAGFVLAFMGLSGLLYSLFTDQYTDNIVVIGIPAIFIGGVLTMMYGFLTRLYIGDDKLVYRNLFLQEKSIFWRNVNTVTVRDEPQHELIEIRSKHIRIKIRIDFKGYPLIKALVFKRYLRTRRVSNKPSIPQPYKTFLIGRDS